MVRIFDGTIGFKHRNAFKLMTASNSKTVKGETAGYFSAILYMAPHTSAGGATLCPYSTPACREMCLAGAGLSALPRQQEARLKRSRFWNEDREGFLRVLRGDLHKLERIATSEGMKPVARLNGTSDIIWERHGIMEEFPAIQFSEYSKVPMRLRNLPPNCHITFSVEGPESMGLAVQYLEAGQSVAIVVPKMTQEELSGQSAMIGGRLYPMVNGDVNDLRFLDPPSSIVLLKPKGYVVTSLMRPDFITELRLAHEVRYAAA